MLPLHTERFSIRRADERGATQTAWLDSRHSFSFGDYIDPDQMGFRALRVINEDLLQPREGFPAHEHRSIEIFTFVISGLLLHEDSLGNQQLIRQGELQYMHAGSGMEHCEVNPSADEPVHFLQIWLQASERATEPGYAKLDTSGSVVLDGLTLLASPNGEDGALKMEQKAEIHLGNLSAGKRLRIKANEAYPHYWVQLIKGRVALQNETIEAGDGFSCRACGSLQLQAIEDAAFMLFRLM
ncbi:MAG: pirin family protein [Verrucomicrobiota bacterium]